MSTRKNLKIEAKQVLEDWEIQWNDAIEDIPADRMGEALEIALHSSGAMKDVLDRLLQYMDDEDDYDSTDLNELRDELSTTLKEVLRFQQHAELSQVQYADFGDGTDDEPAPTEDMFESYPAQDEEEHSVEDESSEQFGTEDEDDYSFED